MTIIGKILKNTKDLVTGAVKGAVGAATSGLKGAVKIVQGDVKGGLSTAVSGTIASAKKQATSTATKTIETFMKPANDSSGYLAAKAAAEQQVSEQLKITDTVKKDIIVIPTTGNTGIGGRYVATKPVTGAKRIISEVTDTLSKQAYAEAYPQLEKISLGGSMAVVDGNGFTSDTTKKPFKLTVTHAVIGIILLFLGIKLFRK